MAPISVLDVVSEEDSTDEFAPHRAGTSGWEKIQLSPEMVERNLQILLKHPDFIERMRGVYEKKADYPKSEEVEANLYDGFLPEADRRICQIIQRADTGTLGDFTPNFADDRLPDLFLHFKGRNFPQSLTEDEYLKWEADRKARIKKQSGRFFASLTALKQRGEVGETTFDGREID